MIVLLLHGANRLDQSTALRLTSSSSPPDDKKRDLFDGGAMKKILKWAAISLGIAFVVMQFIRPAKTNPLVDDASTMSARLQVTPEVEAILNRSCIDCHS